VTKEMKMTGKDLDALWAEELIRTKEVELQLPATFDFDESKPVQNKSEQSALMELWF
jgi:hypothetical protein